MEWPSLDAQSLATIDCQVGQSPLVPAQYEITRRIIYATGDFDFASRIKFSPNALLVGSAALSSQKTIVVDSPMVKVGIETGLKKTFDNPVYTAMGASTDMSQTVDTTAKDWQTFAKNHPDSIFVIGASQTTLMRLLDLIDADVVEPTLVIATPVEFQTANSLKQRLQKTSTDYITLEGCKGGMIAAIAIFTGLAELAWHACNQAET